MGSEMCIRDRPYPDDVPTKLLLEPGLMLAFEITPEFLRDPENWPRWFLYDEEVRILPDFSGMEVYTGIELVRGSEEPRREWILHPVGFWVVCMLAYITAEHAPGDYPRYGTTFFSPEGFAFAFESWFMPSAGLAIPLPA